MTKTLSSILIASLFVACGRPAAVEPAPVVTSGNTATPEPTPTPTPEATPEPTPEPTPTPPAAFAASAEQIAAWRAASTTLDFNARANFGGGALTTGFTPDPWPFPLTAGGGRNPVDVATLNIVDAESGAACTRAFATRRPDFHFTFTAGTTFPLLRFYVVTNNGADATLLINQPNTQWRCNDDHHREGWTQPLMPAIDFHNPAPGRYDIWVGSYDQSRSNPARLFVTELDSNHP